MNETYIPVLRLRRQVFTEVAKLAYEGGDFKRVDYLPYKLLPGDEGTYRDSVFLERAIVGERIRLAMGLNLREANDNRPISDGIEECAVPEKYYEAPLVNVIKFACNKCPTKSYIVSNVCEGCLAHPCSNVCPKHCITHDAQGHAHINQDECIKCGKCSQACPFSAIIKRDRPCEAACGVDAISSDEKGRAQIDYSKCVSCGQCIVNCPFGAIADKSQIFQLITAIKKKERVIAIVAPSFVGQFGKALTPDKFNNACKALGFDECIEVAIGADLCTIEEARDFVKKVPNELDFMATSCCPAWSVMAKRMFPTLAENISMALTPMVFTGRLQKKIHPNAKICFIGPCTAKKLEATRKSIRSDVDFVLTYEELMGMFEAKALEFDKLESETPNIDSTKAGRGFAVSSGVASAVKDAIQREHPEMEVNIEAAEGLKACRDLLKKAKAGKYKGYLLEGMGCPGGCVGGQGTLQQINKSSVQVKQYSTKAELKTALDTKYKITLDLLD